MRSLGSAKRRWQRAAMSTTRNRSNSIGWSQPFGEFLLAANDDHRPTVHHRYCPSALPGRALSKPVGAVRCALHRRRGNRMKRREFIALLGGAAGAWLLAARAQQGERTRRVGVLMPFSVGDPEVEARKPGFAQTLRHLGWTVGANLLLDYSLARGQAESIRRQAA